MSQVSRVARIVSMQSAEIQKMISEAGFAAQAGALDHYSRIATWPGARLGNRILELGCGPGRYVALLSGLGCDVTGVDPHRFDSWTQIATRPGVRFVSG